MRYLIPLSNRVIVDPLPSIPLLDYRFIPVDSSPTRYSTVRTFLFPYAISILTTNATDTYSAPLLLNPASSSPDSPPVSQRYNFTSTGISWPGEADKYGPTAYNASSCVPPPFWAERYPQGYVAGASGIGGGGQGGRGVPVLAADEHFLVWMRTAGLPTFRKLWARNDAEDFVAGVYEIDIFLSRSSRPFPLEREN